MYPGDITDLTSAGITVRDEKNSSRNQVITDVMDYYQSRRDLLWTVKCKSSVTGQALKDFAHSGLSIVDEKNVDP